MDKIKELAHQLEMLDITIGGILDRLKRLESLLKSQDEL